MPEQGERIEGSRQEAEDQRNHREREKNKNSMWGERKKKLENLCEEREKK